MASDKETLREIMTFEIDSYGWLDFNWKEKGKRYKRFTYRKYLDGLDDRAFLRTYNWVRDQRRELN